MTYHLTTFPPLTAPRIARLVLANQLPVQKPLGIVVDEFTQVLVNAQTGVGEDMIPSPTTTAVNGGVPVASGKGLPVQPRVLFTPVKVA